MDAITPAEEALRAAGGTREKRRPPAPPPAPEALQDPDRIVIRRMPRRPASQIPPRAWAYGTFLLFGQCAVIGAVDGGGKGAIAATMAVSIVTGLPLLGEKVWKRGPVAIISYEDDLEEWERRIKAACLHYSTTPRAEKSPPWPINTDEVVDEIHFLTLPSRKIILAALRDGQTIFPDGHEIVRALKEVQAVVNIVDPLNHAHDLQDGNSNVLVAQLAGEITRIQRDAGTAGLVLHHLRKGNTGQADDLMGATSLRATFRSARILQRMDPETAKALGQTEAWRFTRIAGTKENYAPPPDKATWFKLESVHLDNPSGIYDDGDGVAVATPWTPPSPFEGVTWGDVFSVLDAINEGFNPEELYSPIKTTERWAGHLLIAKGRSEDEASLILKRWVKAGVLNDTMRPGKGNNRHDVRVFLVDPIKLADMRIAAGNQPKPADVEW